MVFHLYNAFWVMLMKNVQKNLLDAFAASGLTYDELARRTNLPKSALYRYLNGDTEKIPIDRFQSICEELHLDAGAILGWVSDEEYQQRWAEYQAEQELLREPLSTDEKQLLSCYRVLPDPGKQYIHQQMRAAQLMYGEKSADISDSFMK